MWHLIDGSLLCVLFITALCGAQELLTNPSFEIGVTGWQGDGFSILLDYKNFHQGIASALCTSRTQSWQGPAQGISLTSGRRYEFSAYIQLIDDSPGRIGQPVYVRITSSLSDGTKYVLELATRLRVSPSDGWVHIGGTFLYPNNQYTSATLSVEGPAAGVSYYFDDASLVEIPEYTTWKEDANALIEARRKNNIRFSVNIPSNTAASDYVVHLPQQSVERISDY